MVVITPAWNGQSNICIRADKQADMGRPREMAMADIQTNKQMGRQTDRQANALPGKSTDRCMEMQ